MERVVGDVAWWADLLMKRDVARLEETKKAAVEVVLTDVI